jgi:hypothetical protein
MATAPPRETLGTDAVHEAETVRLLRVRGNAIGNEPQESVAHGLFRTLAAFNFDVTSKLRRASPLCVFGVMCVTCFSHLKRSPDRL